MSDTHASERNSNIRIAYLEGDVCSPKYVAGALSSAGFQVETMLGSVPRSMPRADCILLSDVAAADLGERALGEIVGLVAQGTGLIAVGGWKSFGRGGYARTPLADVLPVTLLDGDDRLNLPGGALLERAEPHEITDGLPFHEPAAITGVNRVTPRAEARTILRAVPIVQEAPRRFAAGEPLPLLVVGTHVAGRVVVLATDPAPHWSGGLTDWGGGSVAVGEEEEVGWAYLEFLSRLVDWAVGGRREPSPERPRGKEARA